MVASRILLYLHSITMSGYFLIIFMYSGNLKVVKFDILT